MRSFAGMGRITTMDYRNGPKSVPLGTFLYILNRTDRLKVASERDMPDCRDNSGSENYGRKLLIQPKLARNESRH